MPPKPKPIQERLWPKVDTTGGVDSCWEWLAAKKQGGYGKIGIGGKYGGWVLAHRVAWELENGQIPSGLVVCHKCDNPGCCNPSHLFLGTQPDNLADMRRKGRDCRGERMRIAVLAARSK